MVRLSSLLFGVLGGDGTCAVMLEGGKSELTPCRCCLVFSCRMSCQQCLMYVFLSLVCCVKVLMFCCTLRLLCVRSLFVSGSAGYICCVFGFTVCWLWLRVFFVGVFSPRLPPVLWYMHAYESNVGLLFQGPRPTSFALEIGDVLWRVPFAVN